jgi:hypothetical protein
MEHAAGFIVFGEVSNRVAPPSTEKQAERSRSLAETRNGGDDGGDCRHHAGQRAGHCRDAFYTWHTHPSRLG